MKKEKSKKLKLIWRFLNGCKLFFLLSIVSTAVTSLADMVIPQIIRAAVDNAIGGNPPTFSEPIMKIVNKFGGFEYLGKNLWIMAIAILIFAFVKLLAQY